jgi:hypothetical protein
MHELAILFLFHPLCFSQFIVHQIFYTISEVSPLKCVKVPKLHEQYSLFHHCSFVSAGDTDGKSIG